MVKLPEAPLGQGLETYIEKQLAVIRLATCALLVEMQNGVVLWKTAQQFLKKLNMQLPYDPAISHLGIHPKSLKAGS